MSEDRCFATVMLDEELWNSLAAVGWQHPAWVQGCTLEHGHDGDHRAPPYRAGRHAHWVQWDDRKKPRLATAVEAPPRRNARPPAQPRDQRPQAAAPTTQDPSSPSERPNPSPSQADALWAIAEALQRLADVIGAALNSTNDGGGRHRRDHSEN